MGLVGIMCLLTGCSKRPCCVIIDAVVVSQYVWINNSSHRIILTGVVPEHNGISHERTLTLAPNEHAEREYAGFGFIYPPQVYSIDRMSAGITTVFFDDGTYSATYNHNYSLYGYTGAIPEHYNFDYDLTREENYDFERVETHNDCRECPSGRFTYTFTDADYEAAKLYGPRAAEPETPATPQEPVMPEAPQRSGGE